MFVDTAAIETHKNMPSRNTSYGFTSPEGEQVVISGLCGTYPNAGDTKEFMDRLLNKEDCCIFDYTISHPDVPPNRGQIKDYHQFDNIFFGISDKRAKYTDTMHRIVLERAYEAILDAGLHPDDIKGSNAGVFVGSFMSDKANFNFTLRDREIYIPLGNLQSMLSNQISYALGLNGPSFNCDTACSSGMYAFEEGFRAIVEGRCDAAIICSTSLYLNQKITLHFKSLGVLNDGTGCRPFDDDATGYTRSDAFVVMVLQKRKDANRVYARVVHTKTNSDGFKEMGITYPSSESQAVLLTDVFQESNVDPSSIAFVEAHGTGTVAGDPQELAAIDKCFKPTLEKPLLIGSNKGNIGHTEPSSGLCAISKVLFMFNFDTFIPNIHYDKPRKEVAALVEGRIKVVTEVAKLPEDARLIAVNCFGFGGANGNAILEKFEKIEKKDDMIDSSVPRLVCFSGRTLEAVRHIQKELVSKSINTSCIRLLHQIFRKSIPQHSYRSFIILKETDAHIVDKCCIKIAERPMALLIGTCNEYSAEVVNELMRIPGLFRIFKEVKTTCENNGIKVNLNGNSNIPFCLILQICLVKLLIKKLNLKFDIVHGSGNFGKLAAAYAKEQLTLQKTIQSAAIIGKNQMTSGDKKSLERILGKQQMSSIFNDEEFSLTKDNKNCFIINLNHNNNDGLRLISPNGTVDLEGTVYPKGKNPKGANPKGTNPKGSVEAFLESIGQLYLEGFNPNLASLYDDISLPVGRGTSMISPLIKWKPCSHDSTYQACKPRHSMQLMEMAVSTLQFYEGHVIDERLLFPATGYLYNLWRMFAETQMKTIYDMCTVFEHVKFHKATHFEPNAAITLRYMIHSDGLFEISVEGSVVATGYIRNAQQSDRSEQFNKEIDVESQEFLLSTKDVYKELRLRGYNYRGKFRSIHQIGPEAALIKWEENWVTFLDNVLQMAILQKDSRNLYVPVGIERLYIDCQSQTKEMKGKDRNNTFITVAVGPKSFGSKYVDVRGIRARSIQKRKQRLQPILEVNRFVPNECECSLKESIRINLQLLLECQPSTTFKCVELLPKDFPKRDLKTKDLELPNEAEDLNENKPIISPFICDAIADTPVISPDLTIVSKNCGIEVENVTVESKMTQENILFVAHSINDFDEAFDSTTSNGFVLCLTPDGAFEDSRFVLLTKHQISDRNYVLFFRKRVVVDESDREFIDFFKVNNDLKLNNDFKLNSDLKLTNDLKLIEIQICLEKIQKALNSGKEVILISQQVQEQSGILGFMNCLRRESGGTKARCVFLMDPQSKFDSNSVFFARQLQKGLPINVLKDNEWGTYRHLLLPNLREIPCDHVYANSEQFGDLGSLKWRQGPVKKSPSCTKVAFSALNFRDLMLAYGKITPDSVTSDRFYQNFVVGIEFSGINSKGEEILGVSKGAITNVMPEPEFEVNVPQGWTLEDAATVLIVYSTCILALKNTAQIRKGQSILIHSGCGGVGLAAINICNHYDCQIFVTVGTEEKRKYLIKHYPNIKASHIGNSRDKSFKQMILKETQGRGVDLVLNSLAEDKLRASVECLAVDGIFLEIGKFDLEMNNDLPLDCLNRGCTYASVIFDVSAVSASNIEEKKAMFRRCLLEGVEDGYVKPIPRTVFKMNELEQAFRFMATGRHIGKVLIEIDQGADQVLGLPRYFCDSNKSYVVFGGLGGFGLELCDWLVMRGAKNIVIGSRNGIQSGYQKYRIMTWQSYGVNVSVNTEDALTEEGCRKILSTANNLGPTEGIFNLAVVLKDAMLENQTADTMLLSYGPKALLTQHLDKLSRQMCPQLGKFVVFSSVSCGRGNAGQTNYGHSNSVMERICEIRRRDGLPALAIQWGAVGDVGLLEDLQRESNEIAIGGTLQQKIANCLEVFDQLIQQSEAVVSSMIVAEKFAHAGCGDDPVEAVAKIIGLKSVKSISKHSPLTELGMDSMLAAEVKQTLERDFNFVLSANDIRTLTFSKLEELACGKLNFSEGEQVDEDEIDKEKIDEEKIDEEKIDRQKIDGKFDFNMIAPSLHMMRIGEKVLTINNGAEKLLLGFPGIDGITESFTAFTESMGAQIKVPHYNIIGDDAENVIDSIANVFYEHVKEEVSRRKSFKIICHSYGSLPAIKFASNLENNLGIFGIIVFIDGAPLLMKRMLEESELHNSADFETNLLEFILIKLSSKDLSKIQDIKKDILKLPTFADRIKFLQDKFSRQLSDEDKLDLALVSNAVYRRIQSVQNLKEMSLKPKLKSKVFLYRPKKRSSDASSISDDYDLSKWCEKVTVKKFNGNHQTILENADMLRNLQIDILEHP